MGEESEGCGMSDMNRIDITFDYTPKELPPDQRPALIEVIDGEREVDVENQRRTS